MKREANGLAAEIGEKTHNQNVEEVPELHEACEQDHGDEDNDGRVNELLVLLDAFDLGIGLPRPARLAKLAFYLTQETGNFRKHDVVLTVIQEWKMARKVGLEPTTNGFGDRYSTN